jgi:hypothetical protein
MEGWLHISISHPLATVARVPPWRYIGLPTFAQRCFAFSASPYIRRFAARSMIGT